MKRSLVLVPMGKVIGTSEMYSGTSAMETGISSVKANAPRATMEDNS